LAELISAQPFDSVPNGAFIRGEKLTYHVFYKTFITGRMNAGVITLEVLNDDRKFNGRDTYHIECIGKSRHAVNLIMKVEDRFESYIDEKSMFPWLYKSQSREGKYSNDEEVEFVPNHNLAISRTATKRTPPKVQDILSAFYFARTTNYSKLLPGDSFSIPIFLGDSIYNSAIVCQERELIKTNNGNFNCVKFRPMVVTGRVFSSRYPMTLWISDDENKIPILIRSALFIGKVEVELVESTGLANPSNSKIN
jgi:hypothetical protein